MHTCVCMYRLFFFGLVFWVLLTAACTTLCFSSIQISLFGQQPVVGPATGHFCRAFIASVSVCFSWLSAAILLLSESVDFLSLLDLYLPVFVVMLVCVCVCVCLCHGVHRQTNRHSREISEIVPAHTRAHTHAEITRTPLSCGGDECDADALSLLIRIYIHRHTSMHVCLFAFLMIPDSWLANSDSLSLLMQSYIPTCIYCIIYIYIYIYIYISIFLSIHVSWWPNSLFLLDIGILICPTTCCRPCHLAFLPGFHRFCEYACFSWLSTEMLCLSESVDFLSFLDMYLPVFVVLFVCVCVCVCVCVTVCTGRQTDTVERLAK
jgi:hypothetical protein